MFGRKALALVSAASPTRLIAGHFRTRARAEREAGRFAASALLLEEALRFRPRDPRLRIQAGHMRKEAGDLEQAEAHYLRALEVRPNDADLALQLGHFYKVAVRLEEAEAQYRRAGTLRPNWAEAERELEALLQREETPARQSLIDPAFREEMLRRDMEMDAIARAADMARLAPQLAPKAYDDLLQDHGDRVDVRRLGRKENGFWGLRRTLRGVEAVRGFCISQTPIVELQILLNGLAIHRGPVRGPYILKFERDKDRTRKYVFNVWLDFGLFGRRLHALEVRLIDAEGETHSFHDHVVIADPVAEADYPGSDALVSLAPGDKRPIEEQIRTRPSMVRDAARALFPDGVRNLLVLRTDQLGDMVASIPAVTRLRAMLPEANIVALVTGANADLARTLGVFDEIIVVDFPDDRTERRRLMPLAEQEKLRERLAPYQFDIALDLAQASVSRDLLRLSGAKFIHGTGGEDWPWLSSDFIFNSHDRWNGMDNTPHSTKVLALVEALGALLKTSAPILRRDDLSRDMLVPFGIAESDRYAVLHAGARIEFSRWPHYAALAERLIAETDLKIVMMTEDAALRSALPDALIESGRLVFMDQRLTFDQFDAFVSFATVLVGNDSGPKHLASLRGVPAVTLFTARINWSEWGQENVGAIISRRVPCAGCAIFHDPEECGKDFVCIRDIRLDEVFDTVMRYV